MTALKSSFEAAGEADLDDVDDELSELVRMSNFYLETMEVLEDCSSSWRVVSKIRTYNGFCLVSFEFSKIQRGSTKNEDAAAREIWRKPRCHGGEWK